MNQVQWIALGLILLALWLNRSRFGGKSEKQAAQPPDGRWVEPTKVVTQAPPTTAQLLSLVHTQTEAEALARACQLAADTFVGAKAKKTADLLPWAVAASNPEPLKGPAPNA